MRAERSRAPEVNPAPSGAAGGQYKPLTPDQIEAVYTTAFRMLEELGMGDSPEPLIERSIACGAYLNDLSLIHI